MPSPVDKPEAAPVAAPRSTRSALRLAAAVAHIAHVFHRGPEEGVLSDVQAQIMTEKDISNEDAAPVWFTSPDNWRPGLLTLDQAAMRAEIVHRPEGFERQ
ncbi:hypothetical protein DFH11DRAFT_1632913 [Phellopilus nigrolimitatus]|nr:hypothetical protein DFH11DRAFT_1632913 [Phellopilus nigrolimitatus]